MNKNGYPNLMCFGEDTDKCDCQETCPSYKECYELYYERYWSFMDVECDNLDPEDEWEEDEDE